MNKGVIFDVDGTLFESGDGIKYCVNIALGKVGAPALAEEKLAKFIGPSLFHSFTVTAGLDEKTALRAVEEYRAVYKEIILDMTRIYDGVEDMLQTLSREGYELSIASSKPLVMVEKLLEKYSLDKYFARVIAPDYARRGSDKSELIKLAAGGAACVMVGDTLFDIEGAHKAGIKAIAVTYGYGEAGTLSTADALADSPRAVCETVAANGSLFEKYREK